MSKRRTGLWALYDFANSLAFVNVSFYFALWLVSDKHMSDMWVSIPVALSTCILLIVSPFLASWSDRIGRRMPFLIVSSLLSIGCLIAFGWIGLYETTHFSFAIIILLYFFFLLFYQTSLVFYDSILPSLAENKTKEQVSGFGMAMGQLGNALGILLVLPFVNGTIHFFGISGRPVAFIIGGILFLLFSLPTYFFLKDSHKEPQSTPSTNSPQKFYLKTWNTLKEIRKNRPLFNYLIVYYLFSDALLTIQLFVTLYLQIVGGFDDKMKTILGGVGLLCAVGGALVSSRLARMLGSTRKAILVFIGTWSICIFILACASSTPVFIVTVILNGFSFGVLYSLSRAYYSDLAPQDKQAEYFSIYTLFEKFASVLGPLVWSSVVFLFAFSGEVFKYRMAMGSLAIVVCISFLLFYYDKSQTKHTLEKSIQY